MTPIGIHRTAACIAALFAGNGVLADVTAQDVWNNWQANLAVYGSDGIIIGSESYAGGVLTVSDIALSMTTDDATVEGTLPQIVFTENGDGTVSVTMSDEFPITISNNAGYSPTVMSLATRQTGMQMTVSGTPEEMVYDVTADRYALEVDEIREGDNVLDAEIMIAFNTLAGSYASREGEMRDLTYSVAVGSVDILVDVNDVENDTVVTFSGKIEDLASAADMTMPLAFDPAAPEALFTSGLAIAGGYDFASTSYLFSMTEYGETTQGSASAGPGTLRVGFSGEAANYDVAVKDIAVSFQGGEIPFPVEISAAQYGVGFTMPLARTEEPAPLAIRLNLTDLTVNDMIWSMIDPGAVLPRDPATLMIELSGTARLLFDLMDPAQAGQMAMAAMPAELYSLSLDALNVSIAGARVGGGGAFTFDNTDLNTFEGLPRPQGELNLQVNGANGLMDKLVQMGLLGEEDVMGARMMMGMIATVTGDDQLESSVVVNEQGHLLVNGQRLQ